MATKQGIPDAVWLVIWKNASNGRIERDAYISEAGAKRAIRRLHKTRGVFEWCYREPFAFAARDSGSVDR